MLNPSRYLLPVLLGGALASTGATTQSECRLALRNLLNDITRVRTTCILQNDFTELQWAFNGFVDTTEPKNALYWRMNGEFHHGPLEEVAPVVVREYAFSDSFVSALLNQPFDIDVNTGFFAAYWYADRKSRRLHFDIRYSAEMRLDVRRIFDYAEGRVYHIKLNSEPAAAPEQAQARPESVGAYIPSRESPPFANDPQRQETRLGFSRGTKHVTNLAVGNTRVDIEVRPYKQRVRDFVFLVLETSLRCSAEGENGSVRANYLWLNLYDGKKGIPPYMKIDFASGSYADVPLSSRNPPEWEDVWQALNPGQSTDFSFSYDCVATRKVPYLMSCDHTLDVGGTDMLTPYILYPEAFLYMPGDNGVRLDIGTPENLPWK